LVGWDVGMTEWIDGWQKKGWKNSQKKAVLNRDLWELLLEASKDKNITWKYVKGHAENPGNNRCDEIATTFADNEPTKLYKGALDSYSIKIV
jgi:ribonuclease HI